MMRSTAEPSRLYLTAELRAVEVLAKPTLKKALTKVYATEPGRFPPVEDLVVLVDRTALRAFVA